MIGPFYASLSGLSLLQSSGRGGKACCFTLIIFLLAPFLVFGVLCLFLTVSWVGLQCVIVAFPGFCFVLLLYFVHILSLVSDNNPS